MKNWREIFNSTQFKNYTLENKSKLPNMAEFSGDLFPGTGDSSKIELNSWHNGNHLFRKYKEKEQTTNLGSSLMNKNIREENIKDMTAGANKVKISWRIYNDFSSSDRGYTLQTRRLPEDSKDKLQGLNLFNWGVGISGGGIKFAVAKDIFRYLFAIEDKDNFRVKHYSVDYVNLVENDINPYDFNGVINFVLDQSDVDHETENTDLDTLLEDAGENIIAISKKTGWRKTFSDVQFKQKPDGTVEIAVEYPQASNTSQGINQIFETPTQNTTVDNSLNTTETQSASSNTGKITSSWRNTLSTLDFKQKPDGTTELHVEENNNNNDNVTSTNELNSIPIPSDESPEQVMKETSANMKLNNKNSCNSKTEKDWVIRQKGDLLLKGRECGEAYGITLEKQGKIIDSQRVEKTPRVNDWREVINSAVWENKFDILAGIGLNSEGITHDEELLINGSGLFFFNSKVDNKLKLEIINWYKTLGTVEQNYVNILIQEAKDEEQFFSQGD